MSKRRDLLTELSESNQYVFSSGGWTYIGPTGSGAKMHWLAKRFYFCWAGQRKRCGNPKHRQYSDYGALGVSQKWTARECINWAINEYVKRDCWKRPAISRFNDLGNYEISNVKLIEQSENCSEVKITAARRESCRKRGLDSRRRVVFENDENSEDKIHFESGRLASEFIRKNRSTISSLIKNGSKIVIRDKTYSPRWEK